MFSASLRVLCGQFLWVVGGSNTQLGHYPLAEPGAHNSSPVQLSRTHLRHALHAGIEYKSRRIQKTKRGMQGKPDSVTLCVTYIVVVFEEIDDDTIMPWTAYEVPGP